MVEVREAVKGDDFVIAKYLCHIALELGLPSDSIRQDWLSRTTNFINHARQNLAYQGFIAELNGRIVGSASCQRLELYPMISDQHQKGYIWGVYVEPTYRRQGIASELMQKATDYLKSIGCTQVVLHTSDHGRSLYSNLGYMESNEMFYLL